jgi:ADP-dependent NAD(P)H-hydrate dehydratase / NAD(P)H-hydrate epimerase
VSFPDGFEPLYTGDEMREAERGHDVDELMARAGRAVADEVRRRYPDARRIAAVCGKGANGGDGRIALELLRAQGLEAVETDDPTDPDPDVVIDALLGTGFDGAPRPEAAALIERMNRTSAPVVAVDVPSGVDASSGETPGDAVDAAVTVTMHGPKVGLAVAPGRFLAGDVVVADIGLEPRETAQRLVSPEILRAVPRRGPSDNKYSAGSVLVVGGSPGLTGAACLAAEAAFRADAGYVAVAAPAESLPVLEQRLLEAVKRPLDDVFDATGRASALALGPGLGAGREELVARLLAETELPAVVDADGLRDFEPVPRPAPTVLTPHEGELARLLDTDSEWVRAHRLEALRRAVERFACVVLLKGSDTLVGAPGANVFVVSLGPPSLATAGTGDVLTGVIASFLAKGLDAQLAATAGAAAQQLAARHAPRYGMVASDVISALPRVLEEHAPL